MGETTIEAIKGFDKDLKCRGYQFEIGKTFRQDGKPECCSNGFHSVEYPLDVFRYYAPAQSRYAVVEAAGEIDRHSNDSKIASASITIKAELNFSELAQRAIDWIVARADRTKSESGSSRQSVSNNSGDQSVSNNSGDWSEAEVSGNASVAIAAGIKSKARACIGSAIVLVNRDEDGEIRHIRPAKVGEDGIKPDIWYLLDDNGEFVEAD